MITEVLAYDSDRLPDDSKHKHLSRPMYLLLFLLVYTCGESLYAQDFSGIVVHGYVSRENPEEFRSQWRKVVFTGQGAIPRHSTPNRPLSNTWLILQGRWDM
jgi:hypothetical protein